MLIPRSCLRTVVTVRPSLGNTGDGQTYGIGYQLKVNLRRHRTMQRTATGDLIDTGANLLLHPADRDRLKIGDEVAEGPDTWTVDKVAPVEVNGRVHHVEVLVS